MEILISKALGFMLVMTRMSAFFICLPIFSWKTIPHVIKISLGLWVAIFFAGELKMPFDASKVTPLQAVLMLATETIYGGAMGLTAALVFSAVKVGGSFADQEMGYGMADILDPLSGEQSEIIGVVLEMLFILLFLISDAHHMFFIMLQKSYTAFPIGTAPDINILTNMVVQAGAVMMVTSLKLAAPILALFIMTTVVLGVLARVLPDINLLYESMPVKISIGLISLIIFLPLMVDFVKEYASLISKLMPI